MSSEVLLSIWPQKCYRKNDARASHDCSSCNRKVCKTTKPSLLTSWGQATLLEYAVSIKLEYTSDTINAILEVYISLTCMPNLYSFLLLLLLMLAISARFSFLYNSKCGETKSSIARTTILIVFTSFHIFFDHTQMQSSCKSCLDDKSQTEYYSVPNKDPPFGWWLL